MSSCSYAAKYREAYWTYVGLHHEGDVASGPVLAPFGATLMHCQLVLVGEAVRAERPIRKSQAAGEWTIRISESRCVKRGSPRGWNMSRQEKRTKLVRINTGEFFSVVAEQRAKVKSARVVSEHLEKARHVLNVSECKDVELELE